MHKAFSHATLVVEVLREITLLVPWTHFHPYGSPSWRSEFPFSQLFHVADSAFSCGSFKEDLKLNPLHLRSQLHGNPQPFQDESKHQHKDPLHSVFLLTGLGSWHCLVRRLEKRLKDNPGYKTKRPHVHYNCKKKKKIPFIVLLIV